MRSAALLAVLVLVGLYAFAHYARRSSMFFPERFPLGDWHGGGEDHFFTTPDGVKLHAWLFRAEDPSAPLMIWFHGNAGNITSRGQIAQTLAGRGVSVFVFDWRGYGKSEGRPTEHALYRDALAAYDYATQRLGARREAIALYGESLGGPYAAYVARHRGARCVIIENSFPSLRDLGNALYAPLPLGWTAPRAMTTTAWLNEANLPVLVMHGKQDQVIPYELGQRLFEGLRVPKEMFSCETAGHCEIASAESQRYYDTVTRFIKNGFPLRPL
jgi:fermentation-respiration switch protein FrsA (DUF1100 family)